MILMQDLMMASGQAAASTSAPPSSVTRVLDLLVEHHQRENPVCRPCLCWEAASVPNWTAVPEADDLDDLVGAACDGYVVMKAALPLPAVVPLLAMTRRQKNLKMHLIFNDYPVDRCDTIPGGCRMEDERLMYGYKPPRLPKTKLLDDVGACGPSPSSVRC
eukprot:TRINITY_DN5267_c0_g1_i2.p1 TRINITY_DN5267_c0_g1~~TRINITY_DN5267_c0_g1_i2.p1  ORF type:complete len:161 (+),score=18.06 TRINITY_DN5267_c0_g1_i2:222-704(+)